MVAMKFAYLIAMDPDFRENIQGARRLTCSFQAMDGDGYYLIFHSYYTKVGKYTFSNSEGKHEKYSKPPTKTRAFAPS